jgi:hypothetical protein
MTQTLENFRAPAPPQSAARKEQIRFSPQITPDYRGPRLKTAPWYFGALTGEVFSKTMLSAGEL